MGQILVEAGRPRANLDRAVKAIEESASQGCRLIVLPECLDLGWSDPCAIDVAQPVPGPHTRPLQEAAEQHQMYVVAGLVERAGSHLFNAAILISPSGDILLHHRKINELDIALDLYSVGDRLGVVKTDFGTMGLSICADNFGSSLAIAHVLCRMGAQAIFSPSAWAVDADHDNKQEPYGKLWRDSFGELSRLYDVTVIGVSSVGWITGGQWQGRKVIGCSLAMGPGGTILAEGPYGENAEAVVCAEVEVRPPIGKGTDVATALQKRGYQGP